jgi:hypothetical protein
MEGKRRLADEAKAFKKGLDKIEEDIEESVNKEDKDSEYEFDFDDEQRYIHELKM